MRRPSAPPSTVLQRWREADGHAVRLEMALHEASQRLLNGRGPPPGPQELARAMAARAEASALFLQAMAEVDRVNECANAVLDAAEARVRPGRSAPRWAHRARPPRR